MSRTIRFLLLIALLAGGGCASLSEAQRAQAQAIAEQARSQVVDCRVADACAQASSLRELGERALAESAPEQPRHYAMILDYGQDSLLARVNLIRSARASIDLQTYIFDHDDSARLVLDELMAAARRGVRVRILVDQLSAIGNLELLASLSGYHRNLSLRVYNPVLNKALLDRFDYLRSALCCFRRFNQRMHNKLLLIDGEVGITGGRNYQDDYFDWDGQYNFRDRDLLVAGPAVAEMEASFELFWGDRRSVPVARLDDVGRQLLREGVPPLPPARPAIPQRVEAMSALAGDGARVDARLLPQAMALGPVEYIADPPKPHRDAERNPTPATTELWSLVENAQHDILLQTPYLVLSKPARELFESLRQRERPPQVTASTNSLAASDHLIVYGVANKYKRYYLRELGMRMFEYKPFPEDAPLDYAAIAEAAQRLQDRGEVVDGGSEHGSDDEVVRMQRTEATPMPFSTGSGTRPVPLQRTGARAGLHAKSLVVDGRIGMVGTHNFDPRSDSWNTEGVVIVDDPAFAEKLAQSIRRDMSPQNSWVIAPREKPPVFSGLNYSLEKISSSLPVFDVWPWRYATSYEFVPGPECPQPLPVNDPDFRKCYRAVGDFPEVDMGMRTIYVRMLMGFGVGLAPFL
ncbi:phospholipase D family protein [Pseudoxanthomonas kalamensis DSM 18571]|uniref:phospholipase D family protein n=1 Tax=Pseudoxanthomonas kalamensis TaxID=289483 RepID=UPI0013909265|nr:phospholipase D family protein [Pseudoxanthomonas kalamensis]KAF1712266.1 phospholipase D family protein [Pseudoxanthomonas kalamensis DSM 18571]